MTKYIHHNVYIDNLGGVDIDEGCVFSTGGILLTHDYSYNIGLLANNIINSKHDGSILPPIQIGRNSFFGANSIVLPGSTIGNYCVIGAGTIIKGKFPDYSIIVSNPGKIGVCKRYRFPGTMARERTSSPTP